MSALDTMTDEELHTDWALASRYMERLDRETERRAELKRESIGLAKKSHIVDIETRYGPTTREYLDALDHEGDEAGVLNADDAADLIAALRRVLDLRDEYANVPHTVHMVRGLDAALAGTQTEAVDS